MTFSVRRATLEDAETLSALGETTFRETFGHLYPPADLEAYLPEAYGLARTRRDLTDPKKATFLGMEDGRAVGFALVGPCELPHPEVAPGEGELKRLYLLASHQGGGRGSKLLDAALAWLEGNAKGRVWLGVWSENHGAKRLYGRRGFVEVGAYEFPVGATRDHELILRRG